MAFPCVIRINSNAVLLYSSGPQQRFSVAWRWFGAKKALFHAIGLPGCQSDLFAIEPHPIRIVIVILAGFVHPFFKRYRRFAELLQRNRLGQS